jgi:hypothetical protein
MTKPAFAQNIISGKIIDEVSKLGISFATIGFIGENIGSTSDKNGDFFIKKPIQNEDSLIISCVGYKTRKIKFSLKNSDYNILLKREEKTLDNIVINSLSKSVILNGFESCSNFTFISNNSYFSQVAQLFEMPSKKTNLNEITICATRSSCSYRIHIFDYNDTLNCPGKELTDTSIIVQAKKSKFKINLRHYNIRIPNSRFFVSIEWLKLASNEIQFKGEKDNGVSKKVMYNPAISYEYLDNDSEIKKDRIWILNFNGKWRNEIEFLKDKKFLISVELN